MSPTMMHGPMGRLQVVWALARPATDITDPAAATHQSPFLLDIANLSIFVRVAADPTQSPRESTLPDGWAGHHPNWLSHKPPASRPSRAPVISRTRRRKPTPRSA